MISRDVEIAPSGSDWLLLVLEPLENEVHGCRHRIDLVGDRHDQMRTRPTFVNSLNIFWRFKECGEPRGAR